MTKISHSILPKKLNELSRQINKASDQLDVNNPLSLQPIHPDIEARFTFVKNLLAAETASHPTKQNHLHHLKEQIEELEAVYRGNGNSSTHSLESTIDHVDNNVAVVDYEYDDDDDHVSKCSVCNELNVSDDDENDYVNLDEEENSKKEEMQVVVFDNALFDDVDRVVEDEFYDRVEARADVEEEESGEKKSEGFGFGKLWWTVASGVVIGMVSVAMLDSMEFDGYEGSLPFLTPT